MFGNKPGYQAAPSDVFGPQVDFEFWERIARAGNGPNTSARRSAIAGLRAATAMQDIAIQQLPETRGQTVMQEGRTAQTGFFLPGYEG